MTLPLEQDNTSITEPMITDIEDLWLILGPGEMLEVDDMSDEAVLRAANEDVETW